MSKAMIAMSGGVDSSVAALLAIREGHEAVGATMRLIDGSGDGDINDARAVCDRLGIDHYVYDMREEFDREVMRRFAESSSVLSNHWVPAVTAGFSTSIMT